MSQTGVEYPLSVGICGCKCSRRLLGSIHGKQIVMPELQRGRRTYRELTLRVEEYLIPDDTDRLEEEYLLEYGCVIFWDTHIGQDGMYHMSLSMVERVESPGGLWAYVGGYSIPSDVGEKEMVLYGLPIEDWILGQMRALLERVRGKGLIRLLKGKPLFYRW